MLYFMLMPFIVMGQLMPTSRHVIFSSILSGEPTLLEPVFLANISVPQDAMGLRCVDSS